MLRPFGNYLLDEEIARGGMARVYRARLRGLGGFEKTLVVKQVLPELARDPRFVRMFVEEAKTLVQMSHPHVVPVYELGVVDGVYFLAMEHVEGATLGDILRDGPLAPGAVAHVGVQVCDALHYAHTRFELVHRDVTPRNVIVDAAGHVRLLDFGIAAPADGLSSAEVFGSPGYMSPEQAQGHQPDLRSDLFSLGVVLFEALTGHRAFLRATDTQTRQALLEEPPPTLAGQEDVPSPVGAVVEEMMHPKPDGRPTSAADVARRLRAWLAAHHPEGVAPELGARADTARRREAARRSGPAPGHPVAPERTDPSGAVRTLATSPALEAILGETGAVDKETAAGARMDGARPAPADDGPGTQPIPERIRAKADAGAPHRPPRRGRTLAGVALAVGVLAGVVGAVAVVGRDAVPREVGTPDASAVAPSAMAGGDRAPRPAPAPVPEPASESPRPPEPTPSTETPRPRKEPNAARTSILTVSATPWAEVALNGRPLGATPHRNVRLPAGEHRLELTNPPLGRSARVRFESEPGQAVRVQADLTVSPPTVTVHSHVHRGKLPRRSTPN